MSQVVLILDQPRFFRDAEGVFVFISWKLTSSDPQQKVCESIA